MDYLEIAAERLRVHAWRDKTMRTTAYCFSLIATRYSNTKLGTRAGRIATALNSTRAFTRLLDDLPMLKATLTYGFGKQVRPL